MATIFTHSEVNRFSDLPKIVPMPVFYKQPYMQLICSFWFPLERIFITAVIGTLCTELELHNELSELSKTISTLIEAQ